MKPPVFTNLLEGIGNTPLFRVSRLDTGPCELFLKLENQNPGGSIKDRIGRSMIEAAEREGRLRPGGTLVEATAGNTGLGLALVAAQKGYRLILVVPDKMSSEKVFHLRALGTEVRITRSDVGKGHPEYYQDMAKQIAEESGFFFVNQFENPANPWAHETTTAPEIWDQMDHRLDAAICGIGSGGTITGLSRFFHRVAPQVEMVLADPKGSVLAHYVRTGELLTEVGSWLVEGIGEDFIPPIADLSRVHKAYVIDDAESLGTARELLRQEGILAGSSSGTLIAAALRYCREQRGPKRVVTFVCDSGNKYLSKMFNDFWMMDQGLLGRETAGNLLDLIARRHQDRHTITVAPADLVIAAYRKMKIHSVSQLPVVVDKSLVGIVDESDLLRGAMAGSDRFHQTVGEVMTPDPVTISVHAPITDLPSVFEKFHGATVMDGARFLGLITRIDLLDYLYRKMG